MRVNVTQARRGLIHIQDESNWVPLLLSLVPSIVLVTGFSMPLFGCIRNERTDWRDWLISGALSALSIGGTALLLRLTLRAFCPWNIEIEKTDNDIRVTQNFLGVPLRRRIPEDATILLTPTYQRGDWGYQIWLKPEHGRKRLLVRPHLESSDINRARELGREMAGLLASALSIKIIEDSWEKYAEIAAKRRHKSG